MSRRRDDGKRGVRVTAPTIPADEPVDEDIQPVEIVVIGAARVGDELVIVAEPSPSLDLLHPVDRVSVLADALEALSDLVHEERAALPATPNNLKVINGGEDDEEN